VSRPCPPEPALLVFGVLLGAPVGPGEILDALEAEFGPAALSTPLRPFGYTPYYEREMGPGIRRAFLVMEGRHDPGDLAALKLRSNRLEERWAREGRRRVNLDPGTLGLGQLVLATGKPAAHRVYLAHGIYAEVEYVFERGSFRPLPWTYPDYREPAVIGFFNGARERLRRLRKETG